MEMGKPQAIKADRHITWYEVLALVTLRAEWTNASSPKLGQQVSTN
jgi:hypothetical protein